MREYTKAAGLRLQLLCFFFRSVRSILRLLKMLVHPAASCAVILNPQGETCLVRLTFIGGYTVGTSLRLLPINPDRVHNTLIICGRVCFDHNHYPQQQQQQLRHYDVGYL